MPPHAIGSDRFNDTYGHPAGDEALKMFAKTAVGTLRESDTIARYGGEEFVVAVREADAEGTLIAAEKIRHAVEQMVVDIGPGRFARLTCSLGAASTITHGTDRMTLMRVADQALYRAKEAGRNKSVAADAPAVPVARGGSPRRPKRGGLVALPKAGAEAAE